MNGDDVDGDDVDGDDEVPAARPVLDQVNIVVGDMEAMAAFYRRLGVELDSGDPRWASHHRSSPRAHADGDREAGAQPAVDLDLDSPAFAAVWNQGWPAGTTGVVIGFRLPSRDAVDELYATLTSAGHAGQQPPYDAFWGSRYAVVADPDGNAVGLMSPSDPALRTRPPDPATLG